MRGDERLALIWFVSSILVLFKMCLLPTHARL